MYTLFQQNIAAAQIEKCHKSKYLWFCVAKFCFGYLELLVKSTKFLKNYPPSSQRNLRHLWSSRDSFQI